MRKRQLIFAQPLTLNRFPGSNEIKNKSAKKNWKNLYNGKFAKIFSGTCNRQKAVAYAGRCNDKKDLQALPSNRFDDLKGDRKDQYSIRIDMQSCICFKGGGKNKVSQIVLRFALDSIAPIEPNRRNSLPILRADPA